MCLIDPVEGLQVAATTYSDRQNTSIRWFYERLPENLSPTAVQFYRDPSLIVDEEGNTASFYTSGANGRKVDADCTCVELLDDSRERQWRYLRYTAVGHWSTPPYSCEDYAAAKCICAFLKAGVPLVCLTEPCSIQEYVRRNPEQASSIQREERCCLYPAAAGGCTRCKLRHLIRSCEAKKRLPDEKGSYRLSRSLGLPGLETPSTLSPPSPLSPSSSSDSMVRLLQDEFSHSPSTSSYDTPATAVADPVSDYRGPLVFDDWPVEDTDRVTVWFEGDEFNEVVLPTRSLENRNGWSGAHRVFMFRTSSPDWNQIAHDDALNSAANRGRAVKASRMSVIRFNTKKFVRDRMLSETELVGLLGSS